jgi:hypothetical protein
MRKLILMMLMTVVSNSAMAEWVMVGGSEDGMFAYADPATIRNIGNKVKMWIIYDYKTAQADPFGGGKPYRSTKIQHEYDCEGEQIRVLAASLHTGNMGKGDMIYSEVNPSSPWQPIFLGSMSEARWKVACGK